MPLNSVLGGWRALQALTVMFVSSCNSSPFVSVNGCELGGRQPYTTNVTYSITETCGITDLEFPKKTKKWIREFETCAMPSVLKVKPPELVKEIKPKPYDTTLFDIVERRKSTPNKFHIEAIGVTIDHQPFILTCYLNKEREPTGYLLSTTDGKNTHKKITHTSQLPRQISKRTLRVEY